MEPTRIVEEDVYFSNLKISLSYYYVLFFRQLQA